MQDTKKVAGELLVELEKKGVTFETVDGKLKYKDSKGNFTENSKEKVKKYKEEIIEILKKKQTIDEFITDNDYETNVYPLTDVQAAYLVGKTEAVKWGGIGCKGYIEVDFGSYSAEELSRAWKVLVNRHEMLRAKVTEVGFEILERDEIDYEIKIVNLQKIWSIYHEIDEIEERPTILYGKALLGQWMGVVDEELRICPEYVSGQIAIGGYSLAEGYLGDTTLTKEKFVYVEEEKNRIYLTGDNGRYVENGDIEFLGRLDNQVKINGHRIEIAEIENAIRGMQNIEDCCVVYNQSIGKGVLIAFIKNKISSISYTKEEYRKQLAFFLPPAMIPSEFVNVERFPLSTNGKIDRKGLAESIQKNIKVKHNAKATLISQKKEYVELAKSIKKIVCSISGNDYIDYEDNLLENGLDSLLLSQISGRIVSDIQEAQGMRFDEILRASLTMPTIMGIAQYISDCKNPSKNQMHSNAGNQTRNSYTVVYIFGDNENEIRDVLIEKLSASNISCKRVGGQEIIERCHEDISVKKKYIIAFSEMASLCITKASELLGENIIINRIFLINPSKAKESDLYLGDISIIDGNSVAIKSWEKAVLGNVREFESNSNDIFDIIMRELENDK